VTAVLLYAFGLSLTKTSGFFWVLSERISKSSVQDWVKKVPRGETQLWGDTKLASGTRGWWEHNKVRWQTNLCVGSSGRVHQAAHSCGSLSHLPSRITDNALRFLLRLRKRCLADPVILTDRGPCYRDSVVNGSGFPSTTCTKPLGCVARLSASEIPQTQDQSALRQH